MAITARISPEIIIFGTVTDHSTRQPFEGRDRGDAVTIDTPGGPVQVVIRPEQRALAPKVLDTVVVVTTINESREYGATLTLDRYLSADDLDKFASATGLVGAK